MRALGVLRGGEGVVGLFWLDVLMVAGAKYYQVCGAVRHCSWRRQGGSSRQSGRQVNRYFR